jgi:prephenate dehydrogenase
MCSARVIAGMKMSSLKCRWFGIHAGFVIGEAPDEMLGYLSNKGYDLLPMTAEEHDERNSIVAMVHFIGMATDCLLNESERQYLRKESPASINLLKLIDHLKTNSPDTYWESQIHNSFTKNQRHRLLKAFKEYSDKLDQGYFPFSERLYDIEIKKPNL